MKTKALKMIASVLVFILTFTYVSILQEAFATGEEILGNSQISYGGDQYVKVTSFLVNGNVYDNKKIIQMKDEGVEDTLYLRIVNEAANYINGGTITIENPNYEIYGNVTSNYVSKVEKLDNGYRLTINKITDHNNVDIEIPIRHINVTGEKAKKEYFRKQNMVIKYDLNYVKNDGKSGSISAPTYLSIVWTTDVQFDVLTGERKLFKFEKNGETYTAYQMKVMSKLRNNVLPVVRESFHITIPALLGENPDKVITIANSTRQIKGSAYSLKDTDIQYNEEQRFLTVNLENTEDENGYISWVRNAQDEITIIALYRGDIQNSFIPFDNVLDYETADGTHSTTPAGENGTGLVERRDVSVLDLVEFDSKIEETSLSKGQIYVNKNVQERQDTVYNETLTADIKLSDMVDSIIIKQAPEVWKSSENDSLRAGGEGTDYTYVKKITINKENFEKILGENGSISLYDGTELKNITNADVTLNQAGDYTYDISSYNISDLKIVTSKPIAEGNLILKIEKAIKGNVVESIPNIEAFDSILVETKGSVTTPILQDMNDITSSKTITLIEPETLAELNIDKKDLSTITLNNDVKLTAILRTDSLDYKLYKNPTLDITLPNYITNLNLKSVDVRFETDSSRLDLNTYNVIVNQDGTRTIHIELNGTQTGYTLGAISKGVNVIITADIGVNILTPNVTKDIVMNYTNNYTGAEEKQATTQINFVAPVGVVTVSQLSNYADNAGTVTGIDEDSKVAVIPTMEAGREANFNTYVFNNYNNTIENLRILGRTMFKDNQAILTNTSLGSTVDMPLKSAISVNGVDTNNVKIYYTENGNATADLNNTANGWTLNVTDYTKVKSYLIVLENTTLGTGEGISFNYNVQIPDNLQYNQSAFEDYVVYFRNNLQSGVVETDKAQSTKMGISTGSGAILEAVLTSNVNENTELQKGEKAVYTLLVKNVGTETARNVIARLNIPSQITVENGNAEVNLGNIEAGSQITKEFTIVTNNATNDVDRVETNAKVTSESIREEVTSNSVFSKIAKTYYSINNYIKTEDLKKILLEEEEFVYGVQIASEGYEENRTNTIVEIDIPNEVSLISVAAKKIAPGKNEDITNNITYRYNEQTGKVTVNLGTVDSETAKEATLHLKTNILPDGVYSKEVVLGGQVSGTETRSQRFEEKTVEVGKPGFKITQTSTITENQEIQAFEDYKYVFEVENLSNLPLYEAEFKDFLPDSLKYSSIVMKYNNGRENTSDKTDENGNPVIKFGLNGKEKVMIEVRVRAKAVDADKEISNKAIVIYEDKTYATSNSIRHFIKKYDDTEVPEQQKKLKRISGQVWLDSLADGEKSDTEERIEGVEVLLFNNDTGKLVRDSSGNAIKTTTSKDGTYTISEIEQGRYTVVFLYNNGIYSATFYHMEGIDSTKNSDAIDATVTLDGVSRIAAITEEIKVGDSNIYNIDLGLIENPKFDLSLDKTVSKITTTDSTGTTTSDYNNTKLAKKDLVGKRINETTIAVEYKITVSNNGAVPGYAKKIVDYIPNGMSFQAELNRDWYVSDNGREIFNSSLSNTIINPGETKEVKLILTKKMTENNLGLISNTAEIYEAYNDKGMKDLDSTPGNKVTTEDDLSSADVLITVKTGEAVIYIGLAIGIIAIISVSAYFIKKKVLK